MIQKVFFSSLFFLLLAGAVFADGLAVSSSCALEGNFGLEVCIDSVTPAYVQQTFSPTVESLKAEFLIDPSTFLLGQGKRVRLMQAYGQTPSPGLGACGMAVFSNAFELQIQRNFTAPDVLYLRGLVSGDFCGQKSAAPIPFAASEVSRVCVEWGSEQFRFEPGFLRLAVVPADQECPADLCSCNEFSVEVSNPKTSISFIRLGSPQLTPTNPGPAAPNDRFCLDDVSFTWSGGSFLDDFELGNTSNWTSVVVGGSC